MRFTTVPILAGVLLGAACREPLAPLPIQTTPSAGTATAGGSGSPSASAAARPFTVRVVWEAPANGAARIALDSAVSRWQHVLQSRAGLAGDAPAAGNCGGTQRVDYGTDDLVLIVVPLPGHPLNVADAAPCEVRADGTTRVALLRVAVDRLAEALPMTPRDIFSHEMGHALGMSPSWFQRPNLTLPSGRTPSLNDNPVFVGARARTAAMTVGVLAGNTGVPIETTDGAFAHWRAAALTGELMAWANVPGMKLSLVTVNALADLGYRVQTEGAEAFIASPSLRWDGGAAVAAPLRIQ